MPFSGTNVHKKGHKYEVHAHMQQAAWRVYAQRSGVRRADLKHWLFSYFRKQYIKAGIFDIELSNIVKEAFDIRNDSDYDDYYILSKDDVEKQIENAEKFYLAIEKYIKEKKDE